MAYGYSTNGNNIMSERAYDAIQEGRLPAKMMIKELKSKGLFKGITAKDIENAVPACEWHHMNLDFKEVNFFFLGDVFDYRKELRAEIKKRKQFNKVKAFFKKELGYVPMPKNHSQKWLDLKMLCYSHLQYFEYLLK